MFSLSCNFEFALVVVVWVVVVVFPAIICFVVLVVFVVGFANNLTMLHVTCLLYWQE